MLIHAIANGIYKSGWFDLDNHETPDEMNHEINTSLCCASFHIDECVSDIPFVFDHIQELSLKELYTIKKISHEVHEDTTLVDAYLTFTGSMDISLHNFHATFYGFFKTQEEFAESYLESLYSVDDFVLRYVDCAKLADDLLMYDFEYIDGYVFRKL